MANDITDYLVRIITGNGTLRALACVTTGLVSDACRRHHTLPTASTALGRALTGGALMGALLKTGERLALRFEGNGPLKKILVEADSNGAVRGCVGVPEVDLPLKYGRLDVAGALGRAGFLTVTKDLGMKEPYQGVVQLYTSEIAEDLAYFFTESEQTPSAVGLGVFLEPDGAIGAAGGFLIQSLPPQDEELVERLMTAIKALPPVSDMLRNGATPEQLLERLFGDVSFTVLEKRALAFVCSCSRERIERVLLSLGRKELTDMLEKDGKAAVTCEFCRETYDFSKLELEQLLESGAIEVSS